MAISEWRLGKRQRVAQLLEWLSATTDNGSEWRIASGEWSNGSDWRFVEAAISRDKISHDRNGGEWRLATGKLLEWLSATTDNGGEIRQKQTHDRKRREDTHWREGDGDG
jgi:hypothetical protein